jgi:glycosyltransferase involved in cell wall biosynthesis
MKEHNKFIIVLLCYNYEKYIKECIDSINDQTYKNYEVIIIDDASTDNTVNIINNNITNKYHLIINKNNKGPLYNHIQALHSNIINDNDIIIHIDGDDKLINNNAFAIVNKAYKQNPNHLVSYGNYITGSGTNSICKVWEKNISVSQYIAPVGWIFSHLRTFKYKLWKHIPSELFYDKNKKLFSSASDVAIMKPVLELAGRERTMFINNKLYFYRDNIPTNEHHKNITDQVRCALQVCQKPSLRKLTTQ